MPTVPHVASQAGNTNTPDQTWRHRPGTRTRLTKVLAIPAATKGPPLPYLPQPPPKGPLEERTPWPSPLTPPPLHAHTHTHTHQHHYRRHHHGKAQRHCAAVCAACRRRHASDHRTGRFLHCVGDLREQWGRDLRGDWRISLPTSRPLNRWLLFK